MRYIYFLLIPFLLLALFASASPFFSIDLTISHAIQNIHQSNFDLIMKAVSSIGNGRAMPFAAISIVSLVALLNFKLEAVYLFLSSVTSYLAAGLAKTLINRPRPDDGLVMIYKQLADKSFPSSHAITYTVIFGFLFFVTLKKLKPSILKYSILGVSAFLILTVGLSRIYLGAHWASDVLGGYLFGAFWLLITVNMYQAHVQR
ncbi:MAG: Phosphoesterase PA-phosphatase related protein [Candidatus Collierbacteria bacterium GW2011_GWB1_44_35]|uniref:Phosphoesterase PA-phosphatase related protein n=6 Tax=Candidatus Collieribacteriota TaxID=1752725 RepID=A0A0G1HI73_9BACT|nr:MAG: Phosphoesterase PA-phosphatase related protein [Candidatus Collierbacteria bacterium GW2011_GWA1_44_12]KKT37030.1 MAG: Phosphoesterase PA-phosphatase related protein [Candidatus Collierbacteria bacterium GW2011_GWF1_44_12]KKT46951.1 MAG: Phosphoesterase PA-phosphatase related protein [Candidatus Collierbacteria bacterium GW2011_GWF2_44_15]KKT67369.1 MAG: Phosphoesterase PA-phosphatase related protein [Candidatus Collierbacteria bacterium GW2011_GWB1_44_35]KKT97715.1 MAG: Phosphoesterase